MAEPEVQAHNSPAVVTFMTTEHLVLQTARSAGIAELNGRAGFYLAAVSSGLIALAFALRNRVEDVQLAGQINRIRGDDGSLRLPALCRS